MEEAGEWKRKIEFAAALTKSKYRTALAAAGIVQQRAIREKGVLPASKVGRVGGSGALASPPRVNADIQEDKEEKIKGEVARFLGVE